MRPRAAAEKRRDFDPHAFLATIGEGRTYVLFPKKHVKTNLTGHGGLAVSADPSMPGSADSG